MHFEVALRFRKVWMISNSCFRSALAKMDIFCPELEENPDKAAFLSVGAIVGISIAIILLLVVIILLLIFCCCRHLICCKKGWAEAYLHWEKWSQDHLCSFPLLNQGPWPFIIFKKSHQSNEGPNFILGKNKGTDYVKYPQLIK